MSWFTRDDPAANTTSFVTGGMATSATSVVQYFVRVVGLRYTCECNFPFVSLESCPSRNGGDPACCVSHVNCIAGHVELMFAWKL